jgi:hypothetical protein
VAINEALEIEMMGLKGENAELLTEMKALREEVARTQDLEKAWEALLVSSHTLHEWGIEGSQGFTYTRRNFPEAGKQSMCIDRNRFLDAF